MESIAATLSGDNLAWGEEASEFEDEASDDGDGFVVLARTPYGLQSVAIVDELLTGERGAALREKRTAPSPAHFSALLSGLKEQR